MPETPSIETKDKGKADRKTITLSVCPLSSLCPILCVFILYVPELQLSTKAVHFGSALVSGLFGL